MDDFEFLSNQIDNGHRYETSMLLDIEHKTAEAIYEIVKFLIRNKGAVTDETLDLILVMHSIINESGFDYTFEETESAISVASEFCVINYLKSHQTLEGIELADNAPALCLIMDDYGATMEAAMCLSKIKSSPYSDEVMLPSMCLFGEWESNALILVSSMLTRNLLSARIGKLREWMEDNGLTFDTEVQYVDFIRKLTAVKLISTTITRRGNATVKLNIPQTGFFLVLSGNKNLAYKLSDLSG